MCIAAALVLQFNSGARCHAFPVHQIEIQLGSPWPRRHQRWLILAPDNVPPENVAARSVPDMRMKARSDHNVVLDDAPIAFAVLDATAEAKVVRDHVERG